MKVSKKGDYGVRAHVELDHHYGEGPIQSSQIAPAQAVNGTADLNEVVVAVSNAEIMLTTVVTVRDRVIQAYQEILKMPI